MFGFGLTKLLVLVAIIAAVWYGFKFVGRLDDARREQQGGRSPRQAAASGRDVEDTVECPVCGAYVVARSADPCDRPDCP